MTQQNTLLPQSFHMVSLSKRMLIGGAIALALVSFFLFQADEPNPAWGKFWMARPLVIVPLAGATGGAFYYFMDRLQYRGWRKALILLLSLVVFIIGLWMGTVLGFAGTYWH